MEVVAFEVEAVEVRRLEAETNGPLCANLFRLVSAAQAALASEQFED